MSVGVAGFLDHHFCTKLLGRAYYVDMDNEMVNT